MPVCTCVCPVRTGSAISGGDGRGGCGGGGGGEGRQQQVLDVDKAHTRCLYLRKANFERHVFQPWNVRQREVFGELLTSGAGVSVEQARRRVCGIVAIRSPDYLTFLLGIFRSEGERRPRLPQVPQGHLIARKGK